MIGLTVALLFAVVGALFTALHRDKRVVILGLWLSQTVVGVSFLVMGLEFLAFTVWVLSTLSALVFLFHALLLGEYLPVQTVQSAAQYKNRGAVPWPLGVVVLFFWGALIAAPFILDQPKAWNLSENATIQLDLKLWSKLLMNEHWISLVAIGILLALAAIGAGFLSRPTRSEEESV